MTEIEKDLDGKNYYTYVLGYDLLHELLSNSKESACDVSYEFCRKITTNFLKSEDFKDSSKSVYELLQNWLNNNKAMILSEYEKHIGIKDTYFLDNMMIVKKGFRGEQPIALVKRGIAENYEYIIAFNYNIEGKKLDWGYGYYYNQNIKKAKDDFNRALAGESLVDTFNKEGSK